MKKFNWTYLLLLFFVLACSKDDDTTPTSVNEDVILKDVSYGPHERNKMDIYLPSGRNSSITKILVFIHGGGWIGGDKSDFNALLNPENLEAIKENFPNVAVFNLNYRLATANDNQYPAAEQDIKTAMDFIYNNIGSYQVSSNTYLLGGSAGAHLAALYTVKNNSNRLKGCIGISGAYDLNLLYNDGNAEAKAVIQTFLGGTPSSNPAIYQQASPINFITASTPKFLILHGEEDALTPLSQAQTFKTALESKNISTTYFTYSGGHGIPPQHLMEGIAKIKEFIK